MDVAMTKKWKDTKHGNITKVTNGSVFISQDDVAFRVEPGDGPDGDLWVRAFGFDTHIANTDEGIVVDIWPIYQEDDEGNVDTDYEPIAGTWAHRNEK